jgi:hypothetical protein
MSAGVGAQMQLADPTTPSKPQHHLFCADAIEALSFNLPMMFSPAELAANKMGITTAKAKLLEAAHDRADGHAQVLLTLL